MKPQQPHRRDELPHERCKRRAECWLDAIIDQELQSSSCKTVDRYKTVLNRLYAIGNILRVPSKQRHSSVPHQSRAFFTKSRTSHPATRRLATPGRRARRKSTWGDAALTVLTVVLGIHDGRGKAGPREHKPAILQNQQMRFPKKESEGHQLEARAPRPAIRSVPVRPLQSTQVRQTGEKNDLKLAS